METFGCTPEIEFFGNSDEVPRVTELHKAYSNSYNLSLRQKQSNSDIRLPGLYCTFDRTATLPMNNSVGFAGFAATSPATRIVDAHANLVINGGCRDLRSQIRSRRRGRGPTGQSEHA